MACYYPMYGIKTGEKTKNNKDLIKIVGHTQPVSVPPWQLVQIPCGRCIGCRLEYSRQWANRCMLEMQYSDSAYFCTFTYDDEHVPRSCYSAPDTGEAFESMTLSKREWQLTMKRIRKRFGNGIRFFMCGEYGSRTFRPHYHAILFNLRLDDLAYYKGSRLGDTYYNSPSLSACWTDDNGNPKGYVVVAKVTWETCAYVARYTVKKAFGVDNETYKMLGMQPEFVLMSRRPGIGRQYFDEHPDLYKYQFINLSTESKGLKFRPPRYFDTLLEKENPELVKQIKTERSVHAYKSQLVADSRSQLSREERLAQAARIKEVQIKSLRRNVL